MNNSKLARPILFAYGAPSFAEQMMIAPVWGILTTLYAEHTTVTLATIGLVLTVSRLLDAVTDPLIGYLSDITECRFGPRKPWIAAGALLSAIAVLFYYIPSGDAGGGYFFIWSSLLFLGWTMMVIPYNAWSSEITGDYQERSRLFAYRNTLGGLGGLVFIVAPLAMQRWTGNTEFNLEFMRLVAYALVILLPLGAGIALYVVPRGERLATDRPSLRSIGSSLRNNRIMWLFIMITIISGLAQGAFFSLDFLFVSNYLGFGKYYAAIGTVQLLFTVGSIPIWLAFIKRFGKHRPWAISSLGFAVVAPIILTISPQSASLFPLFSYALLTGFFSACTAVSAQSMLADIIDYDTLKTGVNRAGLYFSLFTFLSKATLAVGTGCALMLVDWFGYDAKAQNTGTAVIGLKLAFIGIPAILGIISMVLKFYYPLDERKQGIIRKRVQQRAERAA